MAVKKFVVGCFDEENTLFSAVKNVRKKGYKIHDVYTPFPIHGLDRVMGLRDTSLHTAGFVYAVTGTATALSFISWVFTKDWPLNIGGKPNFALPAWVPIICQLAPFVKKHHFHARATDDLFVMAIECTAKTNEAEVSAFLQSVGAKEVNVQEAETGWWLGRYDRDGRPFQERKEKSAFS
jgi:hypothetical protein